MTDQPSTDGARPTPEAWDDPKRPRPNWAPYDLPNSAIRMIEGEQLLQQLGVRDIVAGLASASVIDFQNGLAALKRVFVNQYEEGFKAGQLNVLETSRPQSTTLAVGIVIGVTLTAIVGAITWGLSFQL